MGASEHRVWHNWLMFTALPALAGVIRASADLVAPRRCAACSELGEPLCVDCLRALPWLTPDGQAVLVRPPSAPSHLPPTWAILAYEDPVRAMIVGYKDRDRRDAREVLATVLAGSLAAALRAARTPHSVHPVARGAGSDLPPRASRLAYVRAHPTVVIPVPSSRRARRVRGDRPVADLVDRALAIAAPTLGPGPVIAAEVLRVTRRTSDQAGLDARGRAANLAGAHEVAPRWAEVVAGAHCVLVDDVVTTGATLAEGARVLRQAGSSLVLAAALAATPKRARQGVLNSTYDQVNARDSP